ncbi:hypothetical protein [Sinomicrobium soli]|uniref:hypothetical protein n=1 Tax=Sinomicrobium sp. N-1-3-6 TaxID=2219864 RepID=UPI000DCDBC8D|nr:hypothetical protein [Sinomicrobium sp. N-1-3-6]RAV27417.1 hypothetical protein DN748_18760 [Sinomicrobium sp. N-1-3-6]
MKYLVFYIFMLPLFAFSQKTEKETIYILFDIANKEKCEVEIEGKGIQRINKYRISKSMDNTFYYICDEIFVPKKGGEVDTCSVKNLKKIDIKNIDYLIDVKKKKTESFFKNSIFKKIYFIEPHKDYLMKYEVSWATDLIIE